MPTSLAGFSLFSIFVPLQIPGCARFPVGKTQEDALCIAFSNFKFLSFDFSVGRSVLTDVHNSRCEAGFPGDMTRIWNAVCVLIGRSCCILASSQVAAKEIRDLPLQHVAAYLL